MLLGVLDAVQIPVGVLLHRDDAEGARPLLEKARRLDPKVRIAHLDLGILHGVAMIAPLNRVRLYLWVDTELLRYEVGIAALIDR